MSGKKIYKRPKADFLSFQLNEDLMVSIGESDTSGNLTGTVGGGLGPSPGGGEWLNDKSSYQLD